MFIVPKWTTVTTHCTCSKCSLFMFLCFMETWSWEGPLIPTLFSAGVPIRAAKLDGCFASEHIQRSIGFSFPDHPVALLSTCSIFSESFKNMLLRTCCNMQGGRAGVSSKHSTYVLGFVNYTSDDDALYNFIIVSFLQPYLSPGTDPVSNQFPRSFCK